MRCVGSSSYKTATQKDKENLLKLHYCKTLYLSSHNILDVKLPLILYKSADDIFFAD